MTEFVPR